MDGVTSVQDTRATSVVAANAGEERMTFTAVDVDNPGEATEWSLDRAPKHFLGTNPYPVPTRIGGGGPIEMDRSQSGQIATLDMESLFLEFTADYTGGEDDHEILTIDEMTICIDMGSGRVTGTASGDLMRQH